MPNVPAAHFPCKSEPDQDCQKNCSLPQAFRVWCLEKMHQPGGQRYDEQASIKRLFMQVADNH